MDKMKMPNSNSKSTPTKSDQYVHSSASKTRPFEASLQGSEMKDNYSLESQIEPRSMAASASKITSVAATSANHKKEISRSLTPKILNSS